jgi:antitoxin (DNA-binding transcriptional repressor) of toxin-antitoxin stability system
MRSHIVSATEAARSFSEILNQVRYQGKVFEIQRGTDVIAEIRPANPAGFPISALNRLFANLPKLGREEATRFSKDLRRIRKQAGRPEDPWG